MSDVVLTAAMRSNLMSLQMTDALMGATQMRLSTGLKVNSALDNPQNYFAAKSLNDRASDLTALLDGMGQSINTIKAADKAVESLDTLLDQADALSAEARTELGSSGQEAIVVGNVSFSKSTDMTDYTNIDAGDEITFSFTDANGKAITIDASTDDTDAANLGGIDIGANETVEEIIAQINSMKESSTGKQLMEAKLDENGYLQIKSLMGGDMRMEFSDSQLAAALGYGDYGAKEYEDGAAINRYAVTISKTPVVTSYTLYKSDGTLADRTTDLDELYYKDPSSGSLTAVAASLAAADNLHITANGNSTSASSAILTGLDTATVQDLIDGVNNDTTLKNQVQFSFNETTNQIEIRSLSEDVHSIQYGIEDAAVATAATIDLGFGINGVEAGAADGDINTESIAFGAGAGKLAQLENDYNTIRTQIDALVGDSDYRGVNLLANQNLTTYFNEDNTSSLVTTGADLTSSGLGISAANFSSLTTISAAATEIDNAKSTVRNFASSLSNSLAIIQGREEFTKNMVANLEEGAGKLTIADQNEEGAKMLALQTRQQLGVTSLALASQAQQSVLRLF